MKRIAGFLFRGGLFLALLFAIDQVIVHVPMDVAGLREGRSFYLDFRQRLLQLGTSQDEPSIEVAIDTSRNSQTQPAKASSPRYLYADDNGQLYFADTLEQVPPAYRSQAQPLDD